jgi:hypothetical protein
MIALPVVQITNTPDKRNNKKCEKNTGPASPLFSHLLDISQRLVFIRFMQGGWGWFWNSHIFYPKILKME